MAKHLLFSESISINFINNPNLKSYLLSSLAQDKSNNKNITISNRGGYHSSNLLDETINKMLLPHIVEAMCDFTDKNFNIDILNLWIMENKQHDYNTPHLHEYSAFSGIFYLETPEDSGDLVFDRNDKGHTMQGYSNYFENTDTIDRGCIKPKENMLLIFPSHLTHYVEKNKNTKSRISASFNFNLK
jgi:uncharacterized protein (TIGR02466 family)|tara:strand:+ start:355 stop:915 length:561 start_codon:yes stop_codon:yes gene_type:complete